MKAWLRRMGNPRLSRYIGRMLLVPLVALVMLNATGCELRKKMYNQPKYEPLESSEFFEDGKSARPVPEGTVARGDLQTNKTFYVGKTNGAFVQRIPLTVDSNLVARGRERFNIYCAVCHDRAGTGNGMVVQRGYTQPPSYHSERLRNQPDGYFYDVITTGFGRMPSYAKQIKPRDRWAIVAYVRALQLSQNAELADVPPEQREKLKAKK